MTVSTISRLVALATLAAAACGGSTPPVRYYQLAVEAPRATGTGDKILAVDALAAEGAYDDERIVYRHNPYRMDYYNYHRWAETPGVLVAGYLQQALARTGDFKAVVHGPAPGATLVLGGRITAIEEVDQDPQHWFGHIALELTLTNPATGEVVWQEPYEDTEPLPMQNPEGLARALSTALATITQRAAPVIAARTEQVAPAAQASR